MLDIKLFSPNYSTTVYCKCGERAEWYSGWRKSEPNEYLQKAYDQEQKILTELK